MISIEAFCDKHSACSAGRYWALANCFSMSDAWNKLQPDWLLWVATRQGVLTDKELRSFAVFCARQVEHLLTDQRSKYAIVVAERFANGQATIEELAAARVDAWDVATFAAEFAAWEAASELAVHAAWSTARAAAWAAGWKPDSRHAQAAWLRANTNPKF